MEYLCTNKCISVWAILLAYLQNTRRQVYMGYNVFVKIGTHANTCKLLSDKTSNIIQLLVFDETNIKIYQCAKGDNDQCEAQVNITFQTPINLILGSSNTNYCFITIFRVSRVWLLLTKKGSSNMHSYQVFSMLNECRAVTSQHTCDVTSLDWDEHNIYCCDIISLFIWSHVMHPQPIRDQELGRKSNNVFFFTYWRRSAWTSTQSDRSNCYILHGPPRPWAKVIQAFKPLILLGT